MKKLNVVALGGNSLLKPGQKGTIDEQEANVYETCERILDLVNLNNNIVITHGNGPQVGNILLQNQAGEDVYGIPKMPLDICGSFSQGFIGYMIEQQLRNVFEKNSIDKDILTLITRVLVDKNDIAFKNPSKPIGPYYSKEEANEISKTSNCIFKEDPKGNGWRKVVASPKPIHIGNRKTIGKIAREGSIVIAVGGGGIPVFYVEPNKLQGIDAVIDKDLASALLAVEINADKLYILTDVPNVYINFRTPNEKALETISIDEATNYLNNGQFTEGSMAPKIRAAIYFVENSNKECIITTFNNFSNDKGTRIINNTKN